MLFPTWILLTMSGGIRTGSAEQNKGMAETREPVLTELAELAELAKLAEHSEEILEAKEQLLLSYDDQGQVRNHSSGPNGGRTLPWPVILTNHSLPDLLRQDMNTRPGPSIKTQLERAADIGGPVTIPSGVGLWARPPLLTWSHNFRVIWGHHPNRPDWLDHKMKGKFTMDGNYDITIDSAQRMDEGIYTARFQLKQGGPIYEMNTRLTIFHLPNPSLYVNGSPLKTRKVQLRENEASREITCAADPGLPKAKITWARDTIPVRKEELRDESKNNLIVKTITITHKDHRALLTCYATNNRSNERKTASLTVQSLAKEHKSLEGKTTGATTNKKPEGTQKRSQTNLIFIYSIAAAALATAAIAATLSIITSCAGGQYKHAPSADLPPPLI